MQKSTTMQCVTRVRLGASAVQLGFTTFKNLSLLIPWEKIARNEPQTQWNNYAYRHTYIHTDKFTAVTDHALVTVFNSCCTVITISITLITLSSHVSIINSTCNTIIYKRYHAVIAYPSSYRLALTVH